MPEYKEDIMFDAVQEILTIVKGGQSIKLSALTEELEAFKDKIPVDPEDLALVLECISPRKGYHKDDYKEAQERLSALLLRWTGIGGSLPCD